MVRKILMGFVWFVVFYIGGAAVFGFVLGAMGGGQVSPEQIAAKTTANVGIIALIALVTAVVGSALGWLPGTKPKPETPAK